MLEVAHNVAIGSQHKKQKSVQGTPVLILERETVGTNESEYSCSVTGGRLDELQFYEVYFKFV
jgi:hypothetical protein